METPVDRIKYFAATLNMPINQLEKECGLPRGVGTKIKTSSRPLMFQKIHRRFPILNIEWLKTGEGDMLLPEHPAIINDSISIQGNVSHSAVNIGSSSAPYHSTCDQKLLHTLINKVENLSAQIVKIDAKITRLQRITEHFASNAS